MNTGRRATLAVCLCLASCLSSPLALRAEQEHADEAEASEEHQGGHGEGFHKNTVAVFLGATQAEKEDGERESPNFTFGFDYERRLTQVVGVGAIVDFVGGGERERIVAAALALHAGDAKFIFAPGVEYLKEESEREGILRLGLMYAFPVGNAVHLEPSVFWDVTQHGSAWAWGLTIGKGF